MAPFYDDARELPEPPYPNPARRLGATGTHRCRLRHDWDAIDAAMHAAGWLTEAERANPNTPDPN